MGLDMYLLKRTYVMNWDHMEPEERHEVSVTRNGAAVAHIKPERVKYIIEEVAYWRKANAIHNWFVKNCQNGVDECQDTDVDRKKLEELLGVVTAILDAPEGEERDKLATETLPPVSGFFFGSTEIDKWYYEDLEATKNILNEVLVEPDADGFIYHSSW